MMLSSEVDHLLCSKQDHPTTQISSAQSQTGKTFQMLSSISTEKNAFQTHKITYFIFIEIILYKNTCIHTRKDQLRLLDQRQPCQKLTTRAKNKWRTAVKQIRLILENEADEWVIGLLWEVTK